jgi:outer membrane receptor for ferrienterochelin and colicins
LLGVAFQHDRLDVPVPGAGFTYNVPALFVQDEYSLAPWMAHAGNLRADVHNHYGTFVSPRLSALFRRPDGTWSLRASIGAGFSAPTPFVDEIEASGLSAFRPPLAAHAERAVMASLDAKWSDEGWDVNVGLFASQISDALQALAVPGGGLEVVNSRGPRRAPGAEALIGYLRGPLHLIASWSYLAVTETDSAGMSQDAPLVPRHSAELAGILESAKRGRIGLELGYTGKQALRDDPYRRVSRGYFEINALAELRLGTVAVFMNAINLTDIRQTRYDPLLLPGPGPGGNPLTDVWAPLQGRTFNLGIRAEL